MAENPVEKRDLVKDGAILGIKSELDETIKSLDKFDDKLKSIAKTFSGDLKKAQSDTLKGINELNKAEIQSQKLLQEKIRTEQTSIKLSVQQEKLVQAEIRSKSALSRETERLAKIKEREAKATIKNRKAVIDSLNPYKRLTKQVNTAQARLKRLSVQYGETDKRTVRARKNFERLDNQLRKVNNDARDGRRDVGRYGLATEKMGNSVRKVTSLLAKFGLAMGGAAIVRDVFNVIKDFEQSQADLASVLGVNVSQMALLTDQAKELGATTRFTASQVAGLQTELAKLGFTQQQINDMTPATLALAEATGSELSEAAAVAGGTMNALGLEAKDTQRIVDVMAKSFSSSALDMEKFKETMKNAAPIARATGVSLEVATAAAGKLADANISGSKAGTDLKKIFSELVKDGKPFQQSLNDIAERMNGASTKAEKLAIAEELVGDRAKGALLVLAEQKEGLGELAVELENSEGAAAKMADTQRDTLGGALALLRSAWEGLILSMDEAGGVGETLRKGIVFLADNLGTIVKVLGKVIKTFVAWKAVLFAMKMKTQLRDLKQYSGGLKTVSKESKNAAKSSEDFGKKIKAIGWTAIIVLALELANTFIDIATGAEVAATELDRYNDIKEGATESTNNSVDALNKEIEAFEKRQRVLIANGDIEEEEANKRLQRFIKQKDFVKTIVDFDTGKETAVFENFEGKVNALIEEQKRIINLSQLNIGVFEKTGEFKNRNLIAEEKASIEVAKEQIAILREFRSGLSDRQFELEISAKEFSKFKRDENQEASKQVSLLRAIEDIKIKLINDELARQKTALEVAARRNIEDANKKKTDALELAEFTRITNEKLQADLLAADQKAAEERRIAKLEAARQARQDELDLEASFEEDTEDDIEALTTDDLFLERQKDKRLELLKDEKLSAEELEREFTDFLIEELEFRLEIERAAGEDTIDTEIELAELRRKQREDEEAEILQAQKDFLKTFIQIEQAITDALTDQIDKRISAKKKERDAAIKESDFLRQLAAEGNDEAKDSLAEQRRLEIEAQKEIDALERKKANLKLISAAISTFANQIDGGATPADALAQTVFSTTALTAFLSGLNFFEKGTMNAPEGVAVVDEKGAELITDRKGNIKALGTGSGARMTHLESGDKVYTASQTTNVMAGLNNANQLSKMNMGNINNSGGSVDTSKLEGQISNLTKVVKNKPELNIEAGQIIQGAMSIVESKTQGGIRTVNTYIVKSQ